MLSSILLTASTISVIAGCCLLVYFEARKSSNRERLKKFYHAIW